MTDAEIVKAWEWCEHFENNIVLKGKGDEKCVQALQVMGIVRNVLKDYERQKAEIERLEKARQKQAQFLGEERGQKYELINKITKAKAEARKEFAERLINIAVGKWTEKVSVADIDNLLEEMEGEDRE